MNLYYIEYLDYEGNECGMTVLASSSSEAESKALSTSYNVHTVISVREYEE